MARMAMNENPDIRFSMFEVEAKRGALTLKKARVAAKNRMSATFAARIVTASSLSGSQGRGDCCRDPGAAVYQRWEA